VGEVGQVWLCLGPQCFHRPLFPPGGYGSVYGGGLSLLVTGGNVSLTEILALNNTATGVYVSLLERHSMMLLCL
jgi:hypothetical protein